MLLDILLKVTLPVFVLIGIGGLVEHTLKIDMPTLTRLNFNVFLPALVFIKTLDAGISPAMFGSITIINMVHTALLLGGAWAILSLPAFRRSRPVLALAALLPNAGNYGIPLATLAYGAAGTNVMAIIVMLQIIITVTIGLMVINSGQANWKDVARSIYKTPLMWSVVAALALVSLKIELPAPLYASLNYLSDGVVPVALLTLGIQLSRSRFGGKNKEMLLISLIRLILSPALALLLVWGWETLLRTDLGVAGPVMVIGMGMPAAVNVFILAAEYGQDTERASQTVLWTTILSAVTLTAWLALLS